MSEQPAQTPPANYGPFSRIELSHIRDAAHERGITVSALIRAAVLEDLHR